MSAENNKEDVVSEKGFWISNQDWQHTFIEELSKEINLYISKNKIKSVYDFGCGTGEYLQKIYEMDNSIQLTGFEGHQTNGVFNNIVKKDLSEPIQLEKADLVLSIEVGEHIPKEFESIFLKNISDNSNKHVILSWAIEGQGGLGHINCQNNQYIIQKMLEIGWHYQKETTLILRSKMPNNWIKNTVMVFEKIDIQDEINYHIMHINDERKNNRDQISSIVNGNLLPIETINAKKDNGIEDFMFKNPKFIFAPNGFKNGEKGNFASHYTAWKYLLSTDLENILIFEDDAILHSDFVSKYSLAMSNVPEGYDVLSLFAHENQEPRCLDSHYINDFISKAYQDWSTLSYVVSRQGAKKMIEYVESIGADDPTDWFIFRKGHSGMFNVYTISPTFGSPLKIDTQYVSQVQL